MISNEQLSAEEKIGVLHLIIAIAKVDGKIQAEESAFLAKYETENDIISSINFEIKPEDACDLINTPKAKVVALQEIIHMALLDGHYDVKERHAALSIANILGISGDQFVKLEEWVLQQTA